MSLVVRLVDVVVLLWCFALFGWWGPLVDVDDAPGDVDAVGVWCVVLLFLPLAGGLVGGAGGVCLPAVLASLVLPSLGAP